MHTEDLARAARVAQGTGLHVLPFLFRALSVSHLETKTLAFHGWSEH